MQRFASLVQKAFVPLLVATAAFAALMSVACGGGGSALTPDGGPVVPGALSVTSSAAAPAGTVGQFYRVWFTASAGQTPYIWSVGVGAPPGLAVNAAALEGTPTTAGAYNFTATVTDALGITANKAITLTVNPPGGPGSPVVTTTSPLTAGTVGTAYTQTLAVTGGAAPLTWSISAGVLPPGLSINPATGTISGTPTTAGPYSFTITVTDSASATGTLPATLTINPGGSPAPLDSRIETGIDYMMANQNAAGDFDIGSQPSADPADGARVAITALVCMSLLDYLDSVANPATVKSSINLGIDYIKQNVYRVQVGASDFEFVSWGQMYSAVLLTRLMQRTEWSARVTEFQTERTDILGWMAYRGGTSGANYITWGYSNSFHTAAMYVALDELQQAGQNFSATVLPYTAQGLENMRQGGLTFRYSLTAPSIPDGAYRYQDACGRLGVCGLAAHRAGNATQADLEATVDLFVQNKDWMNQQRLRTDTSASPLPYRVGNATPYCWYYHFGYYYTARALLYVTKAKAQAVGPQLQTDLYASRGTDGLWKAFQLPVTAPSPNVAPGNRLYATAMAIMALKYIEDAMK